MLSYKTYYTPDKKLIVQYFPEENVVNLIPKGISAQKLQLLKSSIETALSVESSNLEGVKGKQSWSLKLKQGPNQNVDEFLRAKGLLGGHQTGDDNTDEEQQQMPAEQPSAPVVAPQQENLQLIDFFQINESTYRSGPYWDDLLGPIGAASKHSITEKDVLAARRAYSRKPKSRGRNKVLRALDKAKGYFFRKLKAERGIRYALEFKNRYNMIGGLVATDYAEEQSEEQPEVSDEMENQGVIDINPSDIYQTDDEQDGEEDPYEAFDILEIFRKQ